MGHQLKIETPDGKPTFMKKSPEQASTLQIGSQKILLPNQKELWVKDVFMDKGQHVRCVFDGVAEFTLGGVTHSWTEAYLYAPHVKGINDFFKKAAVSSSSSSPAGAKYFIHPAASLQQCNNKDWADDDSASSLRYGAVQCGLTSTAQALTAIWPWEKVKKLAEEAGGQFEDWVAGQFKRIGAQSISMEGHQQVLKELGVNSKCYRNRTLGELKEDLKYAPVILGFDYKSSGHFCTAVGYCDNPTDTIKMQAPVGSIGNLKASNTVITQSGIIYNDPYGKRDWSGSANNWIKITQEMSDPAGLHNFCSDELMNTFWCTPDSTSSGWCVVPDRNTKIEGGLGNVKPINVPATVNFKAPEGAKESITIIQPTFLKKSIASASTLPADQKRWLNDDAKTLECKVIGAKAGHAEIQLPDGSKWFIFNAHFKGQEIKAGQVASNVGRNAVVDPAKLKAAVNKLANPNVKQSDIDSFCAAFLELAPKYTITKREHAIHFLAQCFHESGGLMYLEELASGEDYDYRDDLGNCKPEAIAAADKAGISVGRFYKGHSLIQTTGYDNHEAYGKFAGIDAVNHPELLAEYPHALGGALYFWSSRGPSLSTDADSGVNEATCIAITKVVNGGTNGLDDRLHYMHSFNEML